MRVDNSYCVTHDIYGKAVYAAVSDDLIINYFIHDGRMIVSEYDRRTTRTVNAITSIPASLR